MFFYLSFAKLREIPFQVITPTVPALSFSPGAVVSNADVTGSHVFGVGVEVSKVEALVVSPGQFRHPRGFKLHH